MADQRLLTVGHGTATSDELGARLRDAGVGSLVDIRIGPGSRRQPHLHRTALSEWLPSYGVRYRWEQRLGGFRPPPADFPDTALRNASSRGYAAWMRTPDFLAGLDDSHPKISRKPRRHYPGEWWSAHAEVTLFNPQSLKIVRYRYRYRYRAAAIPHGGRAGRNGRRLPRWHERAESPVRGDAHAGFGGGPEKRTGTARSGPTNVPNVQVGGQLVSLTLSPSVARSAGRPPLLTTSRGCFLRRRRTCQHWRKQPTGRDKGHPDMTTNPGLPGGSARTASPPFAPPGDDPAVGERT